MMFNNTYQGGSHVEILTTTGQNPLASWKCSNSGVSKVFDKNMKCNLIVMDGDAATTKISIPKNGKLQLGLTQRYLVLQIDLNHGRDFSLELGVTDHKGTRHRLAMSTSYKDITSTTLHTKIPLNMVRTNIWMNLCIDVWGLAWSVFRLPQHSPSTVQQISLGGSCNVRRIFTLPSLAPEGDDSESLENIIPPCCTLPSTLSNHLEVISPESLQSYKWEIQRQRSANSKSRSNSITNESSPLSSPSKVKGKKKDASGNTPNKDLSVDEADKSHLISYQYTSPPKRISHNTSSPVSSTQNISNGEREIQSVGLSNGNHTGGSRETGKFDEKMSNLMQSKKGSKEANGIVESNKVYLGDVDEVRKDLESDFTTSEDEEAVGGDTIDNLVRWRRLDGEVSARHLISRRSLREVTKKERSVSVEVGRAVADATDDLTESYERQMLESLRRQHLAPDEVGMRGTSDDYKKYEVEVDDDDTLASTSQSVLAAGYWMNFISKPSLTLTTRSEMVRALSPPLILADQEDCSRETGDENDERDEEKLDLVYDAYLNCYFHPSTGKYYVLL